MTVARAIHEEMLLGQIPMRKLPHFGLGGMRDGIPNRTLPGRLTKQGKVRSQLAWLDLASITGLLAVGNGGRGLPNASELPESLQAELYTYPPPTLSRTYL